MLLLGLALLLSAELPELALTVTTSAAWLCWKRARKSYRRLHHVFIVDMFLVAVASQTCAIPCGRRAECPQLSQRGILHLHQGAQRSLRDDIHHTKHALHSIAYSSVFLAVSIVCCTAILTNFGCTGVAGYTPHRLYFAKPITMKPQSMMIKVRQAMLPVME